jgi:hypothetical protein
MLTGAVSTIHTFPLAQALIVTVQNQMKTAQCDPRRFLSNPGTDALRQMAFRTAFPVTELISQVQPGFVRCCNRIFCFFVINFFFLAVFFLPKRSCKWCKDKGGTEGVQYYSSLPASCGNIVQIYRAERRATKSLSPSDNSTLGIMSQNPPQWSAYPQCPHGIPGDETALFNYSTMFP